MTADNNASEPDWDSPAEWPTPRVVYSWSAFIRANPRHPWSAWTAFSKMTRLPLLALALLSAAPLRAAISLPEALRPHLVCAYDFEHPSPDAPAVELDQAVSGTPLRLVNGGADMRVPDGAHPGSRHSLRTRQIAPGRAGNDDWKAGCFSPAPGGVASLTRFRSAAGVTLMGWVKSTAPALRSAPDTNTPAPDDRYNAVCLFGLLHGTSDGHPVRALIELFPVEGRLRLVALGRRLDERPGYFLAAIGSPDELLPPDTWVHLAATFDYATGAIALYRDGRPLPTLPPSPIDDPQLVLAATSAPLRSSPTAPVGIKIGGSFPQNTRERNPFDGRFDDLLFFDRALSADDVRAALASTSGIPGN